MKNAVPKVSVIMSVYNAADTLQEAIDSILEQTFSDWEFIICNDCSTDNSADILKRYQEAYPNKFRLIKNEKNSKLAYSLNRCLALAKGEYVARMDADDISLPERFARQVDFLDSHSEYELVGTLMIPFDANGTRAVRINKEIPSKKDLLYGPVFNHATIMMQKSAYDSLGGYDASLFRAQDYELWFRFYKAGYKGYNMQEALYKVREGANDLKRRTWKVRWLDAKIRWKGYKTLDFPAHYYISILKPFIAGLYQYYKKVSLTFFNKQR